MYIGAKEVLMKGESSVMRARDLGIPFSGTAGSCNAITDVAGVEVGYTTIWSGSGTLMIGEGPVPTGSRLFYRVAGLIRDRVSEDRSRLMRRGTRRSSLEGAREAPGACNRAAPRDRNHVVR